MIEIHCQISFFKCVDKFYFAIASNDGLESCLNVKNDKIIFYCAHYNLHYQSFIFDFGPYNLANCWKYCMHVKRFLKVKH